MSHRDRHAAFQYCDLEVLKLQIKKVRHPDRWTASDEKKLQEVLKDRDFYESYHPILEFEKPAYDYVYRRLWESYGFCIFLSILVAIVGATAREMCR